MLGKEIGTLEAAYILGCSYCSYCSYLFYKKTLKGKGERVGHRGERDLPVPSVLYDLDRNIGTFNF
jgi:hypothetical protein